MRSPLFLHEILSWLRDPSRFLVSVHGASGAIVSGATARSQGTSERDASVADVSATARASRASRASTVVAVSARASVAAVSAGGATATDEHATSASANGVCISESRACIAVESAR
jgi:hypothetical protein